MSATETQIPAAAPLVDTHCHLALLDDRGLLGRALEGAAAAGVERIVSIGLNLDDSDRNRVIAETHPGVAFSVGWHPHEPAAPDESQLAALDELLRHPRAVAVGEVGLDLYFRPGYHETPIEVQRSSLDAMLELAAAHRKPVLVHNRDAHEEIVDAIARHPGVRGVMHCFSGDLAHARRCTQMGFAISFSGIVTFPRTDALREAAAGCDAGAYVVETDSPFLAPAPRRGSVNLPENVAYTAAAVANLRGVPEAAARAETSANANRVLGLDRALGRGVVGG